MCVLQGALFGQTLFTQFRTAGLQYFFVVIFNVDDEPQQKGLVFGAIRGYSNLMSLFVLYGARVICFACVYMCVCVF